MGLSGILFPRLFISYSRYDSVFVGSLVNELKTRGYSVFLDTTDINPGDNFVSRLVNEIKTSTAVIAVISDHYTSSRWGQAELYQALSTNKIAIPILISGGSISNLDEPLQRLLKDVQNISVTKDIAEKTFQREFAETLVKVRRKFRKQLIKKVIPFILGILLFLLAIWWGVNNLNRLERAQTRRKIIDQITDSKSVFQYERINEMASELSADNGDIGEVVYLSQDPAQSDVARFNALATVSQLSKGRESYRWYIKNLNVSRSKFQNTTFTKPSFIGGSWSNVEVENSVFAHAVWVEDEKFSIIDSTFLKTEFLGGMIQAINAMNVKFINSKFRGTEIDTTNFSNVQFITEIPVVEGNPILTPDYTLIEKSLIKSQRKPPEPGVMDMTKVGDDVVFDNVTFIDCRFEGWFRPEWFRNSNFTNCIFPESLNAENLTKAGNIVY